MVEPSILVDWDGTETVLIVDDEPLNVYIIDEILKAHNIKS